MITFIPLPSETGDLQIVRDFYPALLKYVDSVLLAAQVAGLANLYKRCVVCVRKGHGAWLALSLRHPLTRSATHSSLESSYGDWCNLPGTPMCSPHMTGSFSLLENLQQTAVLATALGRDEDARIYAAYHASFTQAFHGAWVGVVVVAWRDTSAGLVRAWLTTPFPLSFLSTNPPVAFYKGNATYDNGVQTCLALALWAQAAPTPELHAAVGGQLLADLVEGHGYHATTGIIGMKYMLEALAHLGRADVAVTMLQQREYPSFGFMLDNPYEPATTIWELWDAHEQGPGMNSRNHVMFGGPVGGWLYKFLAGVRPSDSVGPATAGYREAVLAPPLSACMPLESAASAILTPQGRVGLAWRAAAANGTLEAQALVPVGGAARVVLDGRALHAAGPLQVAVDGVSVTDGSTALPALVEVLAREPDYVELRLPAGRWALDLAFPVDAATLASCRGVGAFRGGAVAVEIGEPEGVAVAA